MMLPGVAISGALTELSSTEGDARPTGRTARRTSGRDRSRSGENGYEEFDLHGSRPIARIV
jgi:hypothetical protein